MNELCQVGNEMKFREALDLYAAARCSTLYLGGKDKLPCYFQVRIWGQPAVDSNTG